MGKDFFFRKKKRTGSESGSFFLFGLFRLDKV